MCISYMALYTHQNYRAADRFADFSVFRFMWTVPGLRVTRALA